MKRIGPRRALTRSTIRTNVESIGLILVLPSFHPSFLLLLLFLERQKISSLFFSRFSIDGPRFERERISRATIRKIFRSVLAELEWEKVYAIISFYQGFIYIYIRNTGGNNNNNDGTES